MKILAIDPATVTGFAHSDGPSGVWDFKIRPDESDGMRAVRLGGKIREIHASLGINIVVFERATSVPGRARATICHSELQGVIKLLAPELRYEYKGYSPAEIKRHATGKGNANKDAMKAAAVARGWHVLDDNHADAMFILDLARSDLGIERES